jgi:hypothetical protein
MAAAEVQPQPDRGHMTRPIHQLRGALATAAEQHGAPTVGRFRDAVALHFGAHDEVVFAFGGMAYKFEFGKHAASYGLNEILSIQRDYIRAHSNKTGGQQAIDMLAWFADQFAPCPPCLALIVAPTPITALTVTTYTRQYERVLLGGFEAALSAEAHAHYLDMRELMSGMG